MAVIVDRGVHRLRRMRLSTLTAAGFLEEPRLPSVMVTLTYAPNAHWARDQIAEFLQRVRVWCKRMGVRFRYVWVLELTKRDVPHYHVLIWLPRGVMLPKPDKRGWWPHGMTRTERARNAIGYLVKYVTKGVKLNAFPKGARICGAGGLEYNDRQKKSWQLAPLWVRARWTWDERPRRVPGGGFASLATGEWEESPWTVVLNGPNWVWVEIDKKSNVREMRNKRFTETIIGRRVSVVEQQRSGSNNV